MFYTALFKQMNVTVVSRHAWLDDPVYQVSVD